MVFTDNNVYMRETTQSYKILQSKWQVETYLNRHIS